MTDRSPRSSITDGSDTDTLNDETQIDIKSMGKSGAAEQNDTKGDLESFNDYVYRGNEPAAYRHIKTVPMAKSDRDTALLIAINHGKENIVRFLVDNGADVETMDNDKQPALIVAARKGCRGICKLLIYGGANIEVVDNYGETPMMLAAMHGHEDVVQLFLECNANAHAQNRYGSTAKDIAERKKKQNVVRLIDNFKRMRAKRVSSM